MTVNITLSGDGLNYSKEATVVQAAQIIGFLNNTEIQPTNSSNMQNDVVSLGESAKQRTSARERLIEAGAKTNAQKILVFADYIVKRDDAEVFLAADVRSAFSKAGEPTPRNFSRDLKEALKLGYVSEDEAQSGHYFITNRGISVLENGFGNGNKTPRRSDGKRAASQSKNAKSISENIKGLDLSDLLEGYPNYHSLSSKTDKAIWILAYTKARNIDGLSGKEIEFISQQLSDYIPNAQIAAAMRIPMSKGFVSKVSGLYRVLWNGELYLKSKVEEVNG